MTAKKTLIGVLASHDSPEKHLELAVTMQELLTRDADPDYGPGFMDKLHFVFTGGTFQRLVLGRGCPHPVRPEAGLKLDDPRFAELRTYLLQHSTSLPDRAHGGLVLLSNLVIHHQCELLWLFLSPNTPHWVNCQNMALLRLSDICFAKKHMNKTSVLRWADAEAMHDVSRCPEKATPLELQLGTPTLDVGTRPWPRASSATTPEGVTYSKIDLDGADTWDAAKPPERGKVTVGLIAHDEMKPRMVDFATQYERELEGFDRIITTGTTGTEINKRCHKLREKSKIRLCQSGPYGGDLEIAAEILAGRCQVVVFFVDPLHSHPHTDDIRVVFAACMLSDSNVLILSNERQARDWFDTLQF